jgi:flavin-dependent dehydrogenase
VFKSFTLTSMSAIKKVDAVIVGGGPAGMATALGLVRAGHSAVVVEKSRYDGVRIGETLPPNARAPLTQLGVWERFEREGHAPAYGIRSAWGQSEPFTNDFIFNPYGNGWHVDRRRFDALLADAACEAGANVHQGAQLTSCEQDAQGHWRIALMCADEPHTYTTRLLIDATGRASTIARRQGAQRLAVDRLVGIFGFFTPCPLHANADSLTLIEAVEDGWWYSARLPDARFAVAYLSDSDLIAKLTGLRDRSGFARQLQRAPHTHARLVTYALEATPRLVGAQSYRMSPVVGRNWLAVGDAALAMDPLSGQGIYHALRMGLRAAQAIGEQLAGKPAALVQYATHMDESFNQYLRTRAAYYKEEQRWPQAAFWQRRRLTV